MLLRCATRNEFRAIWSAPTGQKWPAAARNLNPFPVSPRGKPGREGAPHAGSTLRASKKRWHAAMPPAPPTRGLPPPCVSPVCPARDLGDHRNWGCRADSSIAAEKRLHKTLDTPQRVRTSSLCAAVIDLGGAPIPAAQQLGIPETQHPLPTHAPDADSDRRAAQTAAARGTGVSAHRHRAPRRSTGTQRALSHQCRRRSDAVGNCRRDPADADTGAGIDPAAVPFRGPRIPLRQRQRVHQLQSCRDVGKATHPTNQIARASLRRQRPGGGQERRGDPQTHRVRLHRCKTRRHGRSIPAGAPQPLRELPPAVGRTQDPHRSQRQTPPSLLALGNPLRVISRIASLQKPSAAKRHAGGTDRFAQSPSDTEAALEMQRANRQLFPRLQRKSTA
jgi:hypothetical protein